jgi:transcription elongation GreA/GreB family factor
MQSCIRSRNAPQKSRAAANGPPGFGARAAAASRESLPAGGFCSVQSRAAAFVEGAKMSSAFVREQDTEAVDDLADRPISPFSNNVTRDGLARIDTEIEVAQEARARAQADGDRTALSRSARDLRYWTARRLSAHVVADPEDTETVHFGNTVEIARDDGRKQTFKIVGEDEANPAKGTISHAAPLARAMLGKRVGDVVAAGEGEAEIVKIGR